MRLVRQCGHRTAPIPRPLAVQWLRAHKPLWCHLCRKHVPLTGKAPTHYLPQG